MRKKYAGGIKRFIQTVIFILVLCSCSLVMGTSALASASDEKREVKVAFYPMQGYHEKKADGSYSGVEVEYLQMLSTYTGWNIQYVECDTWLDALRLLDEKKVDLVGGGQYTEERGKKYLYADIPSNYIFSVVATSADSDIAYEDFTRMQDLRYGIVDGYVKTNEFFKYFKENGIENPNVTIYPDSKSLHDALNQGEIDAIVHTLMEVRSGQRVIGRFAANTTYFMSYYGNEELMGKLNEAIADVKYQHPTFEHELMEKYYNSNWDHSTLLTTKEEEYLKKTDEIVVGYVDGYFPFNYEKNGQLQGIVKEVLENQNLPIRFKKEESAKQGLADVENGSIDVMTHLTDTELLHSSKHLEVLCSYADVPFVLVMKNDGKLDDAGNIVTLKEFKKELNAFLVTEDKGIQYKETVLDCLDCVAKGEADACFVTGFVSEYFIRTKPEYKELTISSVLNGSIPIKMVVNENADEEMRNIIQKSIGHITEKEITEYMLQHFEPNDFSLSAMIQENSETIVGILCLIVVITFAVAILIIQDSRKIQKLLYKDVNMDIWNMHYFIKMVEELRKKGPGPQFAIVYTNISRMRQYHLIYGRSAALKIYECLKKILQETVTDKQEICARVSDDHFLLLLKYGDKNRLRIRLEQIIATVEDELLRITENQLQLDLGVVPEIYGNNDANTLIEYAIQVLDGDLSEQNKKIHIYNGSFELQMRECHRKEQMLEAIPIEGNFVVYYQNKVDIRTEEIVGAEALVRMKDPLDHNRIKNPLYFIPYMEQIGRVVEVDFFVLASVCEMLRRRIDHNLKVVPISCNFSRLHFIQPGFADRFERIVKPYHLPKELIEVEITETMVVEEEHLCILYENLHELKKRGIRLDIDDFGSGYSSLGVFEHVPAAVIKMDRSFMVNHEHEERQLKIMKGIVKISEELETDIVCEGVETEEDVKLMRNISTYVAQGYYYSKPRPQEEFEEMLSRDQQLPRMN